MGRVPKIRFVVVGVLLALAALVTGAITSGSAHAVTQAAPKNTGEPRITGSSAAGATLTTTSGDWSGTAPITYAYQWVRCPTSGGKPDGSDCATISGATTSAYVVGSGDVGKRLRARVTASNADGSATVASNATATVTGAATGRPRNTKLPSISGTVSPGSTLRGDPGTWTGTQPITYTFRWLRCDDRGQQLHRARRPDRRFVHAARRRHRPHVADSSHGTKLRGLEKQALRAERGGLTGAGLPPGAVKLPSGEISIPATSVPASERLIVDRVDFSPNPVQSRSTPLAIRVKVKDSRGYVVRDVLVFVRSTPLVTATPGEQRTAEDGTTTYTVQITPGFPIRTGYNVQFFVKAHRQGDNPLGGVAGYRLVHRWRPLAKNSNQNDASSTGRSGRVRCKDAGSEKRSVPTRAARRHKASF